MEFFEVLEPQRRLALGEDHVCAGAKSEDTMVEAARRVVYWPGSSLIGRLPLNVSDQAELQLRLRFLYQRQGLIVGVRLEVNERGSGGPCSSEWRGSGASTRIATNCSDLQFIRGGG